MCCSDGTLVCLHGSYAQPWLPGVPGTAVCG